MNEATFLDLYAKADAARLHYAIIARNKKLSPANQITMTPVDAMRGIYAINRNAKDAARICRVAGCIGGVIAHN